MNDFEKVKIGILDCGIIKDDQRHRAQKIQKIYSNLNVKSQIIKIVEGERIENLNDFTHFIITGSGYDYDINLDEIYYLKEQIDIFKKNQIPTLGICFGAQLIAHKLDGQVHKQCCSEIGFHEIEITNQSKIFENIDKNAKVFQYHFDHIKQIPNGAKLIAQSKKCKNQGFELDNFIGVQFHPEIDYKFAKCEYDQIKDKLLSEHGICEVKFTHNHCPQNQIEKVFENFVKHYK